MFPYPIYYIFDEYTTRPDAGDNSNNFVSDLFELEGTFVNESSRFYVTIL